MKRFTLGTILPTRESIAQSERYAAAAARTRERVAREKLSKYTQRTFADEVRYYDGPSRYAIVTAQGDIRWFVVKSDGDYADKSRNTQ